MTAVDSLRTDARRDCYIIERELRHSGIATVRPARSLKYEWSHGPALDSEQELWVMYRQIMSGDVLLEESHAAHRPWRAHA